MTTLRIVALCGLLIAPASYAATTEQTPSAFQLDHADARGIELAHGKDRISVRFVTPNIVQIHGMPDGLSTRPGIVMDPRGSRDTLSNLRTQTTADGVSVASHDAIASWDKTSARLTIADAQGHVLVQTDPATLMQQQIALHHDASDPLYGIGGYDAFEPAKGGLLRHGVQIAKAGEQGYPGGPFVWSTHGYGVLVDTVGAKFDLLDGQIVVSGINREDVSYDVIAGTPSQIFAGLATLSGAPPMFPKWAMGFTNSQWGIDEQEFLAIVRGYRSRHIPIDNFTFDFDWKAWGDDHYGEFRWNEKKFPDGPTGKLKTMMDQLGMHMTGIMKPRIHVDTVEGRYAQTHGFWVTNRPQNMDYFSLKPVREVDFDQAAARAWFFNAALKHSFDTGIVGWWNDEADDTDSNTQFLNMQRALYDGQRAYAPARVWSINRDFYLGAQRYAYGLWSGDIDTGFDSMAAQRQRMLSAIDVGEMKWGMDGGGFKGHPDDENYARWIEFAAFVPIFRVHGTLGEKRQPWLYGAKAEKAATDAMRLRYALIPYIYSYDRTATTEGIGIVRPLTFDYPGDPKVRDDVDAWMFGDSLLVSPVVNKGQTEKDIYLPAGQWTDYFTGKTYQGGQTLHFTVDSASWDDIPLFIREGAIIPTQPAMDYVGQQPVSELTVDVFPADHATHFNYYDDDGSTYAYEHGAYFAQQLSTQRRGGDAVFATEAVHGSYKPALKYYLVKVHGIAATSVGTLKSYASADALLAAKGEGWTVHHDRYGSVTVLRIAAGQARHVTLQSAASH
ncbi:glycoside hydrolase family 31 protein [Dyella monticola]|uniref:Glycoside hydrolase family 31 protein n=1 Tax=Dyella monticola TaxID=1927958 RepID=A0A370WVL5_9GAMM|nr:TIM-barrel domain-containing protein [Dyella monticola]RDS80184.1 glycoside hydrolase family 31 protein [Dyella monticola]